MLTKSVVIKCLLCLFRIKNLSRVDCAEISHSLHIHTLALSLISHSLVGSLTAVVVVFLVLDIRRLGHVRLVVRVVVNAGQMAGREAAAVGYYSTTWTRSFHRIVGVGVVVFRCRRANVGFGGKTECKIILFSCVQDYRIDREPLSLFSGFCRLRWSATL